MDNQQKGHGFHEPVSDIRLVMSSYFEPLINAHSPLLKKQDFC